MILTPRLHTEVIQHKGTNVPGCIIQQARSTEPSSDTGGVYLVEQLVVYVPAGYGPVTAADEITIRGTRYAVEGQPMSEVSAFTGDTGMLPVPVKRVTGG